jgi:3-oxoacyl-(acyl-carrier-protein) synthase
MRADVNQERPRAERIVVTGLGVVSAAGVGVGRFWSSIVAGRAACTRNERFALTGSAPRAAGLIENFAPETEFGWDGGPNRMEEDRLCRIAEAAIGEAIEDAGLDPDMRDETALYVSSAIGPMGTMEKVAAHASTASAGAWRAFSLGRLPAHLARRAGLGGAYVMVPTGCTGGCDALGYALAALREGAARRAVVGAFEAPVTPLVVASFNRLGATSSRACPPAQASCPFDLDRDGFVLGEGGGALVIETETAALERGAAPLAVVSGYGSVSSGYHMTDIHASGEPIARSLAAALADAGLRAGDIDHVNLHGSSTPQNDVAEANAMRAIFGAAAATIPVTSLKSQIGHALAAANAMELVACVLSLRDGLIPPTANLCRPDPACGLSVVAGTAAAGRLRHVAKTASGFSGIHSSLVLSQYEA